jgi:LytS/YehU family sensor histidine kinase
MQVVRIPLYQALEMGSYETGDLLYRYIYEFQKQIFWIWLTVGVLAWGNHMKRFQDARLNEVTLREQLQDAKLKAIGQQINPHFLFNSLNMISELVYESPEKADIFIQDLSDLLRKSLELGKNPMTQFDEEIRFLDHYLSIMEGRFGERLNYCLDVPDAHKSIEIPALILQPIIENSIKHRLGAGPAGVEITLSSRIEDHALIISVCDSSENPMTPAPDASRSTGSGLENIRKRLHTLYANAGSIQWGAQSETDFKTQIQIPAKTAAFR